MSDQSVKDRIVERCQAVIENDLGIAPNGTVWIITNDLIENWMKSVLASSGVVVDDRKIAISVTWNPDFNSEIRSNQKHVKAKFPFSVKVGYKISNDDYDKAGMSKKSKKLSIANQSMKRQLIALMNGVASKSQMAVLGNEELNKALAPYCKDNEVKWSFADKNKNILKCKLDVYTLLSAMFRIRGDLGKKFAWDIKIVDAIGPGTRDRGPGKDKYREKNAKFTMQVIKRFDEQTYRSVTGDLRSLKAYLR